MEDQLKIKELENQILQGKVEYMKELGNAKDAFHKKEIEFLKQLHEKDLVVVKIKTELANSNALYLETIKALDPRGILEKFENKNISVVRGSGRKEKWKNYASTEEAQSVLNELEFNDPVTVANTAVELFKKLNGYIHESYYEGKYVYIKDGFLSVKEWILMKAVWKLFPLPVGTLLKCKTFEEPEVVA